MFNGPWKESRELKASFPEDDPRALGSCWDGSTLDSCCKCHNVVWRSVLIDLETFIRQGRDSLLEHFPYICPGSIVLYTASAERSLGGFGPSRQVNWYVFFTGILQDPVQEDLGKLWHEAIFRHARCLLRCRRPSKRVVP